MEITLREFSEADLESLYRLYDDKELCELADMPHAKSFDDFMNYGYRAYIDGSRVSYAHPECEYRLSAIEVEGEICGTISSHVDTNKQRVKEFGIVVGRDFWYKSIGFKSLQLKLDEWVNEGYDRIRCEVLQGNRSSNNMMRKLGMEEIAVFEEDNKLYVRYELRLSK